MNPFENPEAYARQREAEPYSVEPPFQLRPETPAYARGVGAWITNERTGEREYRVYDSSASPAEMKARGQSPGTGVYVAGATSDPREIAYLNKGRQFSIDNQRLSKIATELFQEKVTDIRNLSEPQLAATKAFGNFQNAYRRDQQDPDARQQAQQELAGMLTDAVARGDHHLASNLTRAVAESTFSTASYLEDMASNMPNAHLKQALMEGGLNKRRQEYLSEWSRPDGKYTPVKEAASRLDIDPEHGQEDIDVLMALQQNEARRHMLDDPGADDEIRGMFQTAARHEANDPLHRDAFLSFLAGDWDKQERQLTEDHERHEILRGREETARYHEEDMIDHNIEQQRNELLDIWTSIPTSMRSDVEEAVSEFRRREGRAPNPDEIRGMREDIEGRRAFEQAHEEDEKQITSRTPLTPRQQVEQALQYEQERWVSPENHPLIPLSPGDNPVLVKNYQQLPQKLRDAYLNDIKVFFRTHKRYPSDKELKSLRQDVIRRK